MGNAMRRFKIQDSRFKEKITQWGRDKRVWLLGGVVLVGIAILLGWLLQPQDEAWAHIQQTKTLRVVTDASYLPFAAVDVNGDFFGFDIDFAREVGRRLGVAVVFENLTYDALPGAVIVGRDDVVISAFVPQPERTRDLIYTEPYFVSGTLIVISATATGYSDDLLSWVADKRLAVEYGAYGDALARQWARRAANVIPLPQDTAGLALELVANGQAEAAVVDAIAAYDYLSTHPELKIAGPAIEPEPYVIVMSQKSQTLYRELEKILAAMKADGTLAALREKWFGVAAR